MSHDKKVPVSFYKLETGTEPVREWLRTLTKEERVAIGSAIRTVEYGWPIGMPTCKPLKNGLFEVRVALPTDKIARVIFCFHENSMVLLHGFIKKAQKTPKADLDLARQRQKDLQKSHNN